MCAGALTAGTTVASRYRGLPDDDDCVNLYGGAIATGHPLAASGVRLMTQPPDDSRSARRSSTGSTMCVGLGMGGTVVWENRHHPAAIESAAATDIGSAL